MEEADSVTSIHERVAQVGLETLTLVQVGGASRGMKVGSRRVWRQKQGTLKVERELGILGD